MTRPILRKTKRRISISALDAKFSLCVRQRDKKCVRCGKSNVKLDCNHVYGRRYMRLRYDLLNAITMCVGCHFWWHNSPLEAKDWFAKLYPSRYEYLIKAKNEVAKIDREEVADSLNRLLKQP